MAIYTFTKTLIDIKILKDEIDSDGSLSSNTSGISWNYPDSLEIEMESSLPSGEETYLGTLVANHNPIIADAKIVKIKEIDTRTVELINEGFAFDSEDFSLSEPAQINWLGLKTLESLLTWPVDITTINDGSYSLAQADLSNFCGTAVASKQAHLDSGRALKISVNAATDVNGVNAVVDNR